MGVRAIPKALPRGPRAVLERADARICKAGNVVRQPAVRLSSMVMGAAFFFSEARRIRETHQSRGRVGERGRFCRKTVCQAGEEKLLGRSHGGRDLSRFFLRWAGIKDWSTREVPRASGVFALLPHPV